MHVAPKINCACKKMAATKKALIARPWNFHMTYVRIGHPCVARATLVLYSTRDRAYNDSERKPRKSVIKVVSFIQRA